MNIRNAILSTVILLTACSSSDTSNPSIYGSWDMMNSSGYSGIGAQLNSDGTYKQFSIEMTSANSANLSEEDGVFDSTESTLTFHPKKDTCGGTTKTETVSYVLINNDSLKITVPNGIIAFERNKSQSATNVILTFGCFKNGKFTKSPFVKVK